MREEETLTASVLDKRARRSAPVDKAHREGEKRVGSSVLAGRRHAVDFFFWRGEKKKKERRIKKKK